MISALTCHEQSCIAYTFFHFYKHLTDRCGNFLPLVPPLICELQDPKASHDFNDNDDDPRPRDTDPDNW